MKDLPFTLVQAGRWHLSQVAALERTLFSPPWSEEMLAEELYQENAGFLVAEGSDGAVLGYGLVRTVLDEGCLEKIAVFPAARRRGIARAMLRAYLRFGQAHLAFLTLEVRASNEAAVSLYQSLGLHEAGRRKDYYVNPKEDALIMTVAFSPGNAPGSEGAL